VDRADRGGATVTVSQLLKELEASQAQIKQSTDLVYAKTGEITMVRRRLQKVRV